MADFGCAHTNLRYELSRFKDACLISSLSILLISCAPEVYKDHIGRFETATEITEKALKEYFKSSADAELENSLRVGANTNSRITFDSRTCKLSRQAQECVATIQPASGHALKLQAPSFGQTHLELVTEIANYARGLAQVVDARTSEELGSSIDELGEAIKGLRKDNPDFEKTLNPITALVKWLGGAYIDYKKFQILKNATEAADSSIQAAGPQIKAGLDQAYKATVDETVNKLSEAVDRYNKLVNEYNTLTNLTASTNLEKVIKEERMTTIEQEKEQLARTVIGTLNDYGNLRNTDPRLLPDKLVDAHEALQAQLKNPEVDAKELGRKIKDFLDRSKAVYKSIQDHNKEAN